jgi:transposase
MSQKSLTFKKKKHFLDLTKDVAAEKILFCPIDISKHFHIAMLHDINCQPFTDFFAFSASKLGFESLVSKIEERVAALSSKLVFIGMEPSSIYYENLLLNLNLRYKDSTSPRFQLCIVDPAAVSDNRKQHSLRFEKSDQIDTAAIGELLTRGLYNRAHISSPHCIEIKEISRSIKYLKSELLRFWNRFLCRLDRVFPNLMIDYGDEKPICREPLQSGLLDDLLRICPDPYSLLELSSCDIIDLFHNKGRPLGPKRAAKIEQAVGRALLLPRQYQGVHLDLLSREIQFLDSLKEQVKTLSERLGQLIRLTPARHLLLIPGLSDNLTSEFVAALEDWNRYPSIEQVWSCAGLNPVVKQSGISTSAPEISKTGSVHLRNAIFKMASTVIWHEPTFGIACFERLLNSYPFIPTLLHIGRKLTNTALTILKRDVAFEPPFSDYQAAKKQLLYLQEQYLKKKKKKEKRKKK